MSCKCGGGCGPIILRPEIVLPDQSPGDITVDVTDHELEILCDPMGPFLRRYSVDPDGTVTTVDTELDGVGAYAPIPPVGVCGPETVDESPGEECQHCVTLRMFDDGQAFLRTLCRDCSGAIVSVTDADLDGGDYVVTGTVTTCCPDEDESPGDEVTGQPVVLCDNDGATTTPFVRTYMLTDGQVVGVADTDLAGAPYVAAGAVGVCPPDADESPAEPCGTTNLVRLCDTIPGVDPDPDVVVPFLRHITTSCAGDVTTTDTDLDGVTQYTVAGEVGDCAPVETCGLPPDAVTTGATNSGQPGELQATDSPFPRPGSSHQPLPGGGQALWDGGTLSFPADPDGSAGDGRQVYRTVGVALQAPRPPCDDGTVTVELSVDVENLGPGDAFAYAGNLVLYNSAGNIVEVDPISGNTPVGGTQTLSITATVPAADLDGGTLRARVAVETFHVSSKAWEASNFTASYVYGTESCTDEGPVQMVKLCGPVVIDGSAGASTVTNNNTTVVDAKAFIEVRKCDDVNGDGSVIVRYTELWSIDPAGGEDGPTELIGAYLDGDPGSPYEPVSPVPCAAEDCATVHTIKLCDLDPSAEPDANGNICPTGFLRHLVFDCDGQVAAQRDTTLDGSTPYTVVGTVSDCNVPGSALVSVPWKTISREMDPAGVPNEDFVYTVAPEDGSMGQGIVSVHASIPSGQPTCPAPFSFVPGTTLDVQLDAAAQAMDRFRVELRDFDTFEEYTFAPMPDRVGGNAYIDGGIVRSNTDNQAGWAEWDTPPASLTMTFGAPGAPGACTALYFGGITMVGGCCGECGGQGNSGGGSAGGGTTAERQIIERCRCDDTDGDGIGDTEYVELWQVSADGNQLLGTFEATNLAEPYDPISPAPCPADSAPAQPEPLTIHTGGGSSTSSSAATVDLAGAVPRLLSATITVLSGPPVVVTTANGSVSIPAVNSLTWSVQDNHTEQLDVLTMQLFDGTGYLLNLVYAD